MPPINPLKIINFFAPSGLSNKARLPFGQRLQGALRYGLDWLRMDEAQSRLADLLSQYLDRRFLLLLNFAPYPNAPPFPPILLGPSGIHVLYPTTSRGDFRVRENRLWVYDSGRQRYKAARDDVVQKARLYRDRLQAIFNAQSDLPVRVDARVVFLDPAAYADALQSDILPILVDGLPRYLEQLSRSRQYGRNEIQTWLRILQGYKPKGEKAPRPRPVPPRGPKSTSAAARPPTPARIVPPRQSFFGFTPRQWLILTVLLLINLVLLALLVGMLLLIR